MRELARRSGLSPAQVSRIEAGEVDRPSTETLSQLADALDRRPQLLLAALDRLPESEAFNAVFLALIYAIPDVVTGDLDFTTAPTADPELIAALLDLVSLTGTVDDLELEGVDLDQDAAVEFQVLDSWRQGLDEANQLAVETTTSSGASREASAEAGERLAEAERKVRESKAAVTDLRQRIQEHQRTLDVAEERLARFVRDLAARLFVRHWPIAQGIWQWPERGAPTVTPQAREQFKRMLARIRKALKPSADEMELGPIAEYLALFSDTDQDLFADARRRLTVFPNDRQFREVARAWEHLTPERRRRVVEFVQDQHRLSTHELVEEQRDEARSAIPHSDSERQEANDAS
jgi:transcriptional regulator with XRE-family HTH domain